MSASNDNNAPIVYWHRDLPPLEAELMAEHTVEASSSRVSGTLAHRDELWDQCYQQLMTNTMNRLIEEVARLGGHYAHVHDEAIRKPGRVCLNCRCARLASRSTHTQPRRTEAVHDPPSRSGRPYP
jgi:hypothetical protein